jgi:hypothetical protein
MTTAMYKQTRRVMRPISYPDGVDQKVKAGKPLDDGERKEVRKTDQLNALRVIPVAMARDDLRFSWIRVILIATISLTTVAATVALVISATQGKDLGVTITSGAVALGTLAFAGIISPSQVLQSDEVFRRWSDTIVSSYLVELAGLTADTPGAASAAAKSATARFETLAMNFQTFCSSTDKAVAGNGKAAA